MNKPYDIFGTWYNDRYLLSGDLHWLAHLLSTSILWLSKASQESSSEHLAIMNQLYKFCNQNASSIRAIMVANCLAPEEVTSGGEEKEGSPSQQRRGSKDSGGKGNPVSHQEISASNIQNIATDFRYSDLDNGQLYDASPTQYVNTSFTLVISVHLRL